MCGKQDKRRRRLEREMEESSAEARARMDEFCDDLPNQPDGEVFHACSLGMEHGDTCNLDEASGEWVYTDGDGDLMKCLTLDKWDVAISHESTCWRAAGMRKDNVQHDLYAMDVSIQSLVECMIQFCGVTHEQLNSVFKPMLYKNLHDFRIAVEPTLRRKQLTDGLGILGPNGGKLN